MGARFVSSRHVQFFDVVENSVKYNIQAGSQDEVALAIRIR